MARAAPRNSSLAFGAAIALAAALAACGGSTSRPDAPGIADPGVTPAPAAPPGAAQTAEAAGSPAPPNADGRPPLIVPAAVAERTQLPWCGHEVIERETRGDIHDAEVRECFLAAYGIGEPAEFVSDGLTVEGGRVRTIYRSIAVRSLEIYYDSTADSLSARDWVFMTCTGIQPSGADPNGVPIFFPDRCTDPQTIAGSPETDPTADELLMAERLVLFAQSPNSETLGAVPWTDAVGIGLADELIQAWPAEALVDPASWTLDAQAFRGRVGPFSALDLLAGWDVNSGGPPVRELQLTVGEHPHCASAPVPPPVEVAELRRLSLQPVGIDSCIQWWTVDLFLDPEGRIAAVTLDLFEP